MATGKLVVAWTIRGAIVFGRMWRSTSRRSRAPSARAATTNSRSRSSSTAPRVSRAKTGTKAMPMATRLRAAVAASARLMTAPSTNVRWRRLLIPDARVERGVGQVHREVDEDDRGRHEERHPLHHRQVARADGDKGEPPQPGQREHRL